MAYAVVVHILEQLVPGQLRAAPHDARDPRVVDRHVVFDPALAGEAQPHWPG